MACHGLLQGTAYKGRTVITRGGHNPNQRTVKDRTVRYGGEVHHTVQPTRETRERRRHAPTRYGGQSSRSGDGGNGQAPISPSLQPAPWNLRILGAIWPPSGRHLAAIICTTQRPQKPAAHQRHCVRQDRRSTVTSGSFSTARAPPKLPRPPVRKPYTYQPRRPAPPTGSWALCVREHSGSGGVGAISDWLLAVWPYRAAGARWTPGGRTASLREKGSYLSADAPVGAP
ncbi:hypothetical protein G7Z17_g6678 [Cylindrodendrum hubeiense]|uniref:Uncharacterized protein n=1 Tax=Cylindrodendrum hubeiense TaxID=595255 RepID=A0A9P5H4X8_9HYPO|nr:hypothetical protein G7Z17_g6678 [Cylindrodendrum hubeiense]